MAWGIFHSRRETEQFCLTWINGVEKFHQTLLCLYSTASLSAIFSFLSLNQVSADFAYLSTGNNLTVLWDAGADITPTSCYVLHTAWFLLCYSDKMFFFCVLEFINVTEVPRSRDLEEWGYTGETLMLVHIWLPGVICTLELVCWQESRRPASESTAEVLTGVESCATVAAAAWEKCQWNKTFYTRWHQNHSVRDDSAAACVTMLSQHNAINIIVFHNIIPTMSWCVIKSQTGAVRGMLKLKFSVCAMRRRLQDTFPEWCCQNYQKMWHVEWKKCPPPLKSFNPV